MGDLVANLQLQVLAGRNLPGKDKHGERSTHFPFLLVALAYPRDHLDSQSLLQTLPGRRQIRSGRRDETVHRSMQKNAQSPMGCTILLVSAVIFVFANT